MAVNPVGRGGASFGVDARQQIDPAVAGPGDRRHRDEYLVGLARSELPLLRRPRHVQCLLARRRRIDPFASRP